MQGRCIDFDTFYKTMHVDIDGLDPAISPFAHLTARILSLGHEVALAWHAGFGHEELGELHGGVAQRSGDGYGFHGRHRR